MIIAPERPNKDTVIWRYISLDKYLDLLLTNSIKFTQVDIAADRLEVSLMLKKLTENGNFPNQASLASASAHVDIARKSHYISCWTGKKHECRSLWFTYLGESKIGVAIKTTVGQFIESIDWKKHHYDYRKIDYRNEFNDLNELISNPIYMNVKAVAYSSEEEIRFNINKDIIEYPKGKLSADNPPRMIDLSTLPKIISLDVNLNTLINEVWISPYCQGWQIDTIQGLTEKLVPEIESRLKRSDVDEWI